METKIIKDTVDFIYYHRDFLRLKAYQNAETVPWKEPWWTLRFLTPKEKMGEILKGKKEKIGIVLTSGESFPEEHIIIKKIANILLRKSRVRATRKELREYLLGMIPASLIRTINDEMERQGFILAYREEHAPYEFQKPTKESRESFLIQQAIDKLAPKYPILFSRIKGTAFHSTFLSKNIIVRYFYDVVYRENRIVFIRVNHANVPTGILVVSPQHLDCDPYHVSAVWDKVKDMPFEPIKL